MLLKIDFNSDKAVYIRLRNQIIMGVATNMVREGDTLSSVRRTADYIGINMHTVNKAYSVLRQEDSVELDRRRGVVVNLDADKMQAIDDVRGDLGVVLAWGIYKSISRDKVRHLVDEIYDKYTRGCMGTEDGRETGEGQKLPEHEWRLSVRIFRRVLKKGQDRAVQKVRVWFWITMEDSYVMRKI